MRNRLKACYCLLILRPVKAMIIIAMIMGRGGFDRRSTVDPGGSVPQPSPSTSPRWHVFLPGLASL
jgi:hypothetical protein